MKKITTGIDIVNIDRIRKTLFKNADRFLERIFTEDEINYISTTGKSPETIAGMFAAKEAISKVLGTGIGAIGWRDIEIRHNQMGKPYVKIFGKLEERMSQLIIHGIEISISHERDIALAFALGYGNREENENIRIDGPMKRLLPRRPKEGHKGNFGRLALIGGSSGMTGAPYLSSMAALRTGAGLVYTLVPKALELTMSIKLTEAIIRSVEDGGRGHLTRESLPQILGNLDKIDVVAIGPGMGTHEDSCYILEQLVKNYRGPMVIDADGINCLAHNPNILSHKNRIVITPHVGEMSRLLKKEIAHIEENRIYYSNYLSNKYNIVVVLKGHRTVVSYPGEETYINESGNVGMATAGSGDVLTGMVASFLAQGLGLFDASKLAVYCHGVAGDMARADRGEHGLIASDIMENIPGAIRRIQLQR